MFAWTPYPFVRIVLFFCAGIAWGIYGPDTLPIHWAQALFGAFTVLFILTAYAKSSEKLKTVNPGVIGLFIILLAGFIQVYHATDSRDSSHFMHDADTIRYYKAVVTKQAQEKENSWKIEAAVLAIQSGQHWQERTGKVLLYFSKKSFTEPYQYGDVLLIKGSPRFLNEPANPGEFDYKKFLAYRKIYHHHFLQTREALLIGHEPPSWMMEYSIRARVWADEALQKNISGEREQATASALVLGVTDGLDNDLIGAYAATGSLHVLSVSGLHVGIIYWLILLILKPLNKTTSGKWTLAIVSMLVLWAYAGVTGLSPSVLRAVTMFSFVAVARPWSRRTNIYNTLAASAFCLLLFEPYLIMSVGFQLSYLAVIGIVYLQPILARWWQPKHWLWENVWQITSVSMAAQLATFALGLLYFHQFPVYFLFSNLFVIPASFIVLVLGVVLVAVSSVPFLAAPIGFLLEWTIRILNYGVIQLETLPFSLIDNVYITTFQCWLLMAAIVFAIVLLEFRKFGSAVVATVCVLIFSALHWNHFYREINTRKFTVYKVSGQSAWDIIDRGQTYFFADSSLTHDQERIRFHIHPNRLQSGVSSVTVANQLEFVKDFPGCRLVAWNGLMILQIHEREFVLPNITPDYVVLGHNAIASVNDLSSLKFKKLILDSSNSFYFADKIVKETQGTSLEVHSVLHEGAFVAKL